MIAETAALADGGRASRRRCAARGPRPIDFERIGEMEAAVWGNAKSWYADTLEPERRRRPRRPRDLRRRGRRRRRLRRVGAVPERHRLRHPCGAARPSPSGADAASTVRSSSAARSSQPSERRRYLEVDASADSRPILERLGFRRNHADGAVRLVALGLIARALRVELRLRLLCQLACALRVRESTRSCLASRSARSAFVSFFFAIVLLPEVA